MHIKLYITLPILFLINVVHAQTITTIAGTGESGINETFTDGVAAVQAHLWNPNDVVVDDSGNVFITDWGAVCIRKIDLHGIITTVMDKTAFTGNLHNIAVDTSGNLYIAQYNSSYLYKQNRNRALAIFAGTGYDGYHGDDGPAIKSEIDNIMGLVIDNHTNIFLADERRNVIRKIAPDGIITTIAGYGVSGYNDGFQHLAKYASFNMPNGLAVDREDNLYVCDKGNNVVRKISASGVISTVAGNGKAGYSGDGDIAISAQLNNPVSIAVSSEGIIYISDQGNNAIRMINKKGIITTVVGNGTKGYKGDGDKPTLALLNAPNGITIDKWDNLYIADMGNHVVRKVTGLANAANGAITKENEVEISTDVTANLLIIKIKTGDFQTLSIEDNNRKVLIEQSIKSNITKVNVQSLLPGEYYFHLKTGKETKTYRFTKD